MSDGINSDFEVDLGNEEKDQDRFSEDDEQESLDSDAELQVALQSGLLKPGLNVELPATEPAIYEKEKINDLASKLQERNLEWLERMDVTCEPLETSECIKNEKILEAIQSNDLVNDDFKRELTFFGQAQAAAGIALPKLRSLGLRTERPTDYMAEMAKSDDHMKKVRERLLSKTKTAERVEKIRKLRDAKKFAKKVQLEKEKAKLIEKKALVDKVDQVRKGKSKDLSFLDEDALSGRKTIDLTDKVVTKALLRNQKESSVVKKKRNKLREARDLKYGHGGKKRNKKRNDKASFNAPSFKAGQGKNKQKTSVGKGSAKGKNKR